MRNAGVSKEPVVRVTERVHPPRTRGRGVTLELLIPVPHSTSSAFIRVHPWLTTPRGRPDTRTGITPNSGISRGRGPLLRRQRDERPKPPLTAAGRHPNQNMKNNLIPATLVAFLIIGTAAIAADKKTAKVTFASADTDLDGKVSLREYTSAYQPAMDAAAAKTKFSRLDKNKDGSLSSEEFAPPRKPRAKKETAAR